ncbi:MAG: methionyl-tRNA formyltransferase [Actinobacteria bacterium]|nr:methionyl-tRNA formyltransferase [Actinomycetota bacterium]
MTSATPRRLVYLGSPQAAVAPLRALVAAEFDIALVVSQPDRRRGRGGALAPSPVKAAAAELGLAVSDQVGDVIGVGADLGVVVAFGRLIGSDVLEAVPMVNLHFSLLPRWRGAAPVERALLAGDAETGVCLMALEAGLDTGPVHECVSTPIDDEETADELRSRLVELGTEMLVRNLVDGLGTARPQEGQSTYAAKIDPRELEIDWRRPASEIHRLVRLGAAWTTFRGRRLKVRRATGTGSAMVADVELTPGAVSTTSAGVLVGTGTGPLELVEVQPEGKPAQRARDWANGARPGPAEHFGGSGPT